MILPIYTEPDPILHQKAAPITEFTPELATLVEDMRQTMHNAKGVGLAAPQIGRSIALLIIENIDKEDPSQNIPLQVIINPRITWKSLKQIKFEEGCLSLPGWEGDVKRPERVRLKAKDIHGNSFELEANGLLARVIQHEADHLQGILFNSHLPKKQLKQRRIENYPIVKA